MRVLLSLVVLPLLVLPASAQALDWRPDQGERSSTASRSSRPSTTRQRFTMVFTPDGKATREQLKKAGESAGEKTAGTLEGGQGRLLHLVEAGLARDLLSARPQFRLTTQMVGDEGRGDSRELDQAAALILRRLPFLWRVSEANPGHQSRYGFS